MKNEKLSWKVSLGLNLSGSSCLPSLKLEQQFGNNWGTPTTSLMTVQNPWLLQLLDFLVSLCNVLCVVTYKNISCGGGLRSNVRGEYLSKWTGPFPWTLLSINHPFAIWWQQVLVQQLALKVNIWYSHFMVTQQKPCLESRKLLVSSIHQGIHSNSLLSSAEISEKQTESQTFYPCTCQEQTCSAEHSQCGARQCCGLGGFSKAVCLVYSKTSEHIQSRWSRYGLQAGSSPLSLLIWPVAHPTETPRQAFSLLQPKATQKGYWLPIGSACPGGEGRDFVHRTQHQDSYCRR